MNYILWDVDGTLVRNGRDAGNLYHDAVELAAGHPIGERLPNRHGRTDGEIIRESLELHGLDAALHSTAIDHLDELSRLRHVAGDHRALVPGALEAVAATAAAGWTNGLLTGNSAARARYKVTGAGFAESSFDWTRSYFGERSPIRAEITLRARAALGTSPIVIIGDTPNDGVAALEAGMTFLAVATGAYTAAELAATSAALVIDDLESGLQALLAALSKIQE